jgi:hypothetical protein
MQMGLFLGLLVGWMLEGWRSWGYAEAKKNLPFGPISGRALLLRKDTRNPSRGDFSSILDSKRGTH